MASLRQGCGDLRGLVSTFTQSCQCSLNEARGQVRTTAPSLAHVLWAAGSLFFHGGLCSFFPPQRLACSNAGGRLWNQNSL